MSDINRPTSQEHLLYRGDFERTDQTVLDLALAHLLPEGTSANVTPALSSLDTEIDVAFWDRLDDARRAILFESIREHHNNKLTLSARFNNRNGEHIGCGFSNYFNTFNAVTDDEMVTKISWFPYPGIDKRYTFETRNGLKRSAWNTNRKIRSQVEEPRLRIISAPMDRFAGDNTTIHAEGYTVSESGLIVPVKVPVHPTAYNKSGVVPPHFVTSERLLVPKYSDRIVNIGDLSISDGNEDVVVLVGLLKQIKNENMIIGASNKADFAYNLSLMPDYGLEVTKITSGII